MCNPCVRTLCIFRLADATCAELICSLLWPSPHRLYLPPILRKPNTTNDPDGFFSSDAFATELIDSLDNRTGKDAEKPFFAYLAFSAPHLPLQCPKAYREPYKGMYDDGPDALRLRRLARLREMGLLDESARAHEVIEPWMKEWQDMTDEERAKSSRSMEVYAGMVSNMDFNVGRVLDYLTETNQRVSLSTPRQRDIGSIHVPACFLML